MFFQDKVKRKLYKGSKCMANAEYDCVAAAQPIDEIGSVTLLGSVPGARHRALWLVWANFGAVFAQKLAPNKPKFHRAKPSNLAQSKVK